MGLIAKKLKIAVFWKLEFPTSLFRRPIAKNILMLEECGQRHSTTKGALHQVV